MADLASTCKDKLAYFRIKELKDILNQLGLPKQGKKQDLIDRVLALLSDEQGQRHHGWGRKNPLTKEAVAKIVDDTYSRKMRIQCAPDLATRSHSGSDFSHFRPKEEAHDSFQVATKVRCLCGSTMLNDNMIKCEDDGCQVLQHMSCVLIPDKPTEGVSPEVPPHFYCELCRLNRADPFWVTTGNPLLLVKFMSSGVANDGTSELQTVEKNFQLSRSDRETVQRPEYDLQVWCMLMNDKVQFRMQWPQYAELHVNGIHVRVVSRPGSQILGINGRDDGPLMAPSVGSAQGKALESNDKQAKEKYGGSDGRVQHAVAGSRHQGVGLQRPSSSVRGDRWSTPGGWPAATVESSMWRQVVDTRELAFVHGKDRLRPPHALRARLIKVVDAHNHVMVEFSSTSTTASWSGFR